MAWVTISNTAIDQDSPITTSLITALRDNPIAIANGDAGAPRIQNAGLADNAVNARVLAADCVGSSELANASVIQAILSTTDGSISVNGDGGSTNTELVLPGGQYGFYPQFALTGNTGINANDWLVQFTGYTTDSITVGANLSTTRRTLISVANDITSSYTPDPILTIYQRYINSSPPYNLGDGEVPLFVYATVREDGKFGAIYVADVPPWAYNGPTSVRVDRICKVTKKRFQTVTQFNKETGELRTFEREVCDKIKNADMHLLPHPFTNAKASERIVLLEPVMTEKLLRIKEAGEEISSLLYEGYLKIGNEVTCKSPNGVCPVSFRFRNSN